MYSDIKLSDIKLSGVSGAIYYRDTRLKDELNHYKMKTETEKVSIKAYGYHCPDDFSLAFNDMIKTRNSLSDSRVDDIRCRVFTIGIDEANDEIINNIVEKLKDPFFLGDYKKIIGVDKYDYIGLEGDVTAVDIVIYISPYSLKPDGEFLRGKDKMKEIMSDLSDIVKSAYFEKEHRKENIR